MAYIPTNWQTGDTITAEKLNKIENAVVNASDLYDIFVDIIEISDGFTISANGDSFTDLIAKYNDGILRCTMHLTFVSENKLQWIKDIRYDEDESFVLLQFFPNDDDLLEIGVHTEQGQYAVWSQGHSTELFTWTYAEATKTYTFEKTNV